MSQLKEPIRILSDLHLAHPGSRIVEARQLAPLLDGVKTLILNGDTSEERLKKFSERSEEQVATLREMCAEAGVEMVMLRGNHDPLGPTIGSLDLCGGQVFVTHGDILYEDVSPWSRSVKDARAARLKVEEDYPADYREDLEMTLEASRRVMLEMAIHQPRAAPGLKGKLKTLLAQAWPAHRPLVILKTWLEGTAKAEETRDRYRPEAKVFVVGHTHRAVFFQRRGQVVVNTGAFLPLSKALAVDIEGRRVTVRRVMERKGEFVLGKVVGSVSLDSTESDARRGDF